jgi:glutaredoxin
MIDVCVLTQPDCRYCDHAAQVLFKVAQDYPLAVTLIPLSSAHGAELAARHGVAFAPGILLDGQMFGYGRLSERRLRRHLARPAQPDRA